MTVASRVSGNKVNILWNVKGSSLYKCDVILNITLARNLQDELLNNEIEFVWYLFSEKNISNKIMEFILKHLPIQFRSRISIFVSILDETDLRSELSSLK